MYSGEDEYPEEELDDFSPGASAQQLINALAIQYQLKINLVQFCYFIRSGLNYDIPDDVREVWEGLLADLTEAIETTDANTKELQCEYTTLTILDKMWGGCA